MKKMIYLVLALFLLSTASVNAQVTIGSQDDPHGGAVLDLKSPDNNKGLKMPQVALTSATDWAPVTGTHGYWWSATLPGQVFYGNPAEGMVGQNISNIYWFSVRCVQDK